MVDKDELRPMSEKLKIQLSKLSWIIFGWVAIATVITCYDFMVLHSDMAAGPVTSYKFSVSLAFNIAAGLMGSLMGGSFLVFYVNEKLRERPYGYTILAVAISFVAIVVVITLILGLFLVHDKTGRWPFESDQGKEHYLGYLSSTVHLKNIIVWSIVTALTQFSLQINDKFGQGLLWAFISGKYHSPKQENRVFMFLDLMSSTNIAEQLGNEKYYNLLRDFYADITNSIIYNGGEIYQYVGDEVVISWRYESGIVHYKCINCFYDIRGKIAQLAKKYEAKYNLVPDFKAALHYGHVTAGEIGIIKRDITYSGDVLNTTSRILSKCNEYSEKLLISGKLLSAMRNLSQEYKVDKIGDEPLRGKVERVEIYAVNLVV